MGIHEDIAQFEQSLNELIIKYEQYFLGLEKREPVRLLEYVERLARKYANVKIVNTMLNFKYTSLVARLNSYKQYWGRIVRLMEEGKYSRDRFRMARQGLAGEKTAPESQPPSKSDADELFQRFVDARKACNLPVETITREMIAAAIEKQKPAIIARYGTDQVEFRVVVENGVPKIKARSRRTP
ncbi:MAG: hypothetical protein ED859_02625 [Desulfuromonadales bacterium]|nr:MAG: hypothetical protein ED859_02625 [Desulfuromonadales bacterium]